MRSVTVTVETGLGVAHKSRRRRRRGSRGERRGCGSCMDPVQRGFAQSYARPGGMVTGNVLNALGGEDTVAEKRISLFKELVPSLTRLGMFGPSTVGDVIGILFEKRMARPVRKQLLRVI